MKHYRSLFYWMCGNHCTHVLATVCNLLLFSDPSTSGNFPPAWKVTDFKSIDFPSFWTMCCWKNTRLTALWEIYEPKCKVPFGKYGIGPFAWKVYNQRHCQVFIDISGQVLLVRERWPNVMIVGSRGSLIFQLQKCKAGPMCMNSHALRTKKTAPAENSHRLPLGRNSTAMINKWK